MKIVLTICAVSVLAITVYLVCLNWASETIRSKIITAASIGLVGLLVTTWFSLKSETTELEFGSTLFLHKSDKTILDQHHADWLQFGGAQFDFALQSFIGSRIEQDEELNKAEFGKDSKKITEFYHDVLFIKLFSHFSMIYVYDWDVRIRPLPMGGSGGFTFEPVDPGSVGGKFSDKLKWADISEVLDDKSNHYCPVN